MRVTQRRLRVVLVVWFLISGLFVEGGGRFAKQSLPLPLNLTVSGALTTAAETDRYVFQGVAGQELYLDALDAATPDLSVSLMTPTGETRWTLPWGIDGVPFFLTESGSYELRVTAVTPAGGAAYRFRLVECGQATRLTSGTAGTVNRVSSLAAAMFQLSAKSGDECLLSFKADGNRWAVYLPTGDKFLVNSPGNQKEGRFYAPLTGDYVVVVEAQDTSNPPPLGVEVLVTLTGAAPVEAAGFGAARAGAVEAGQTATFELSATGGTWALFSGLLVTDAGTYIDLKRPDGELIRTFGLMERSEPFVLPVSGVYSLVARGTDPSLAGSYNFRILNLSGADALPAALATEYQGKIEKGDVSVFRFQSRPGQRFFVDALVPTPSIALYEPGSVSATTDVAGGEYSYARINKGPGVCYLVLATPLGASSAESDFRFRLLEAGSDPVTQVTLSAEGMASLSGTIDTASSAALFRIQAAAGQRLFFDSLAEAPATWALFDPTGASAAGLFSVSTDFEFVPLLSGMHLLYLNATAPSATFKFQVVRAVSMTNALSLGAITSGNLRETDEEHHYVFEGRAGQQLYYDALDADSDNIPVRLEDPNGVLVGLYRGNSDTDVGPFKLSANGPHRLIVGGGTDVLADYRFRLIDVSLTPAVGIQTDALINGTLNAGTAGEPVNGAHIFRFSGTAGQQLFFDSRRTVAAASWFLYGPLGDVIDSSNLATDMTVVLPVTADFTLILTPPGQGDAEPYTFQIVKAAIESRAIALSGQVSGTLATPGAESRHTFDAARGQSVYFDALSDSSATIYIRLIDPLGRIVASQYVASDFGPLALDTAGRYTLAMGGYSEVITPFGFRLLDVDTVPQLTFGAPTTGVLTAPRGSAVYGFQGVPGQRLKFEILDPGVGRATWSVRWRDGTSLVSGKFEENLEEFTVVKPGTHVLVIQPGETEGNLASSLSYVFKASVVPDVSVTATGFGVEHSGVVAAGSPPDDHAFTAPAGTLIFFDSLDSTSQMLVDLSVDGVKIWDGLSASTDIGQDNSPIAWPLVLPKSGVYTVSIRNPEGGTGGSYKFKLLDVSKDAVPAEFNTLLAGAVGDDALRVYRFQGVRGQRLFFDSLISAADAGNAVWRLAAPSGDIVMKICGVNGCYSISSSTDFGPVTLQETGVYHLILAAGAAPNSYRFKLLDVTGGGGTALTLDTDVGGNGAAGLNLDPFETRVYRFATQSGRRFFMNTLNSDPVLASWQIHDVDDGLLSSAGLSNDFEATSTQTGTGLLLLTSTDETALSYGFRVVTPDTVTVAFTPGSQTVSGTLPEAGSDAKYVFNANLGDRFYYDGLPSTAGVVYDIRSPLNGAIWSGTAETDSGSFRVPETATYTLTFHNPTDGGATFQFRLLRVIDAGVLEFDKAVAGNLPPNQALLFRLDPPSGQKLLFRSSTTNETATWNLFNKSDGVISGVAPVSMNLPLVTSMERGTLLLVVQNMVASESAYSFMVVPGNHAPQISQAAPVVTEEQALAFTVAATDAEQPNEQITYSLAPGAPSGLSIDPKTGAMNWTPAEGQGPGIFAVTVLATDDGLPSITASRSFQIQVLEKNRPPVLAAMENRTVVEGSPVAFTATATDPDLPANTLAFSLDAGAPAGSGIDAKTGAFSWTPAENQGPGVFTITVRVTDSGSADALAPTLSDSKSFTVAVEEKNQAPVITAIADKIATETTPLSFQIVASDADLPVNTLSFSLGTDAPSGSLIDPVTGVFSWTPSEAQGPGTFSITVRVTDTGSADKTAPTLSAAQTLKIQVLEKNRPPVLAAMENRTVVEGSALTFSANATDPDLPANTLAFSLDAGAPAGSGIDAKTGVFLWTPAEDQGPGVFTITVRVTDSGSADAQAPTLGDTKSFTVTVEEKNQAPTIAAIADKTVAETTLLSFKIVASDADLPVNSVSFSLGSDAPAGALIDPVTGVFSWTPTEAQGPGTFSITVRVADSGSADKTSPTLNATQTFKVTVNESNEAPVLASIADAKVKVGQLLRVVVAATDSDLPPNKLSFGLGAGAPQGAVIDAASGVLQWTPGAAGKVTIPVTVTDSGSADSTRATLTDTKSFDVTVEPGSQEIPPPLIAVEWDGAKLVLKWGTVVGARYTIQFKRALDEAVWTDMAGAIVGDGKLAQRSENPSAAETQRFYRVIAAPSN